MKKLYIGFYFDENYSFTAAAYIEEHMSEIEREVQEIESAI